MKPSFYFFLLNQDAVLLSGPDHLNFLNNYCSQDVLKLKDKESTEALFLTQKGKIVSTVEILKLPKKLLLIFPEGYAQRVREHLDIYLGFSESQWESLELKDSLILTSPGAQDFLHNQVSQKENTYLLNTKKLGQEAWQYLAKEEQIKNLEAKALQAGAKKLEEEEIEILRLEQALPKQGQDFSQENLAAETGLDQSHVSFNKGCYLGQEPTARIHSQGRTNQKILSLQLESFPQNELPLKVFQKDKNIGLLSSAVQDQAETLALAMLKTKELEEKSPLSIEDGNHWITAHLRK